LGATIRKVRSPRPDGSDDSHKSSEGTKIVAGTRPPQRGHRGQRHHSDRHTDTPPPQTAAYTTTASPPFTTDVAR